MALGDVGLGKETGSLNHDVPPWHMAHSGTRTRMKRKRLGEVLHERGKISAKDLEKALAEQEHKISYLGELLLERGLVEKSDLIAALEEVCLVPYVDIALTPVEPGTLRLIPREFAERFSVLPIRRDLSRLVVVMSDPRNASVLKELRSIKGMGI
jgi:hypothetical protein